MQDEGTGGSDVLVYDFTALPKTTSGSGLLTIATTGTGTDGIDLDQLGEFFGLDFGGTDLGRYECDDANDGGRDDNLAGKDPGRTCRTAQVAAVAETAASPRSSGTRPAVTARS